MSLTRRAAAKQLGGALLAATAIRLPTPPPAKSTTAPGSSATAVQTPTPVVSFFLDQPYLDASGLAMPYQPPQGMRAGQPLAALSETEFRHLNPHA